MKVDSDNSIYSLFVPKAKKSPSVADEKFDVNVQPPKAPQVKSDEELVGDFYSRMADQLVDAADVNGDGKVTKDEYMAAEKRLAEANHKPFDQKSAENYWSKLDTTGKGSASEDDILGGLKNILNVNVGHLDPGYAEAFRTRALEK